jgi:hypothetical protein
VRDARHRVPGGEHGAAGGLLVLALTGCQTTQDRSAALRSRAAAVDGPGRVKIGRPEAGVRVLAKHELRAKDRAAVVVELRNTTGTALRRVPVSLRIVVSGEEQYANDRDGADELLLRVPLLPARGRVAWVNADLPAIPPGARLTATLGSAKGRAGRGAKPLRITGLRRDPEDTGESGVAVAGVVHNDSRQTQTEVPVYLTVRRGTRTVAAGTSRISSLGPRASARFEAFLVGDGRTGRLSAVALPTKPQTPRSSR